MSLKRLVSSIVHSEILKLNEKKSDDTKHAAKYVKWLKGLKATQERPSGWKVGRLKKEKIGKVCAFCARDDLVGVEHIIPRGIGGPKFDKWNLAWSCYYCNKVRGSDLGVPQTDRPMIGWLGKALKDYNLPTKKELSSYLKKNDTKIFEGLEEKERYLYHVTYFGRLNKISDKGLVPGAERSIGGSAYDSHAKQGIFLSGPEGINYWFNKSEQFAEHNSDNAYEDELVPVVLRINIESTEGQIVTDDLGEEDSRSGAYIHKGTIDPSNIEVWDGGSWIPVANYWDIDTEAAFEIEEGDDESDDNYYYFKDNSPLQP